MRLGRPFGRSMHPNEVQTINMRRQAILLPVLPALLAACQSETGIAADRILSPAESNCLAAVAEAAEEGDVAPVTTAPDGDGTVVIAQVTGTGSRWTCRADAAGMVEGVAPSRG